MIEDKLNRLKEVLSIPTYSHKEDLMIEYLENVFQGRILEKYMNILITNKLI